MNRIAISAIAAACIAGPAVAQQAPSDSPAPGANFLTAWDLDEDGQVTLEELQSRRADIFASFDSDEDGMLSAEEFDALETARMDGMQRPSGRGQGVGRGEQPLRRDAIDSNRDGIVSQAEYTASAAAWLEVMDGTGDGVLTIDDFGPGARQAGMGQSPGQGQGQGRGNGQGQGQDQWQGQRQGGHGKSGGHGQGQRQGQGQRMGADRGDMQGRDMMRGQGKGGQGHDGQRGGRGQQNAPAAYGAFPTADGGLWIVDSRTGDILYCRASIDSSAPAGFTPVCVEAEK